MAEGWFSQQTLGDAVVIDVVGEIDIANVRHFEEEIQRASERATSTVVVSFERATYIDSATINALIDCSRKLRARGGNLVVAAPPDNCCTRIFRLIGIDKLLPVTDTVGEAVTVG